MRSKLPVIHSMMQRSEERRAASAALFVDPDLQN